MLAWYWHGTYTSASEQWSDMRAALLRSALHWVLTLHCLPVMSSFSYCWGLCGAQHSPLGVPSVPKLWSQVTTHHKGYVLVTVLLLGRGTMTKSAYKRQHLRGNLLQFQRVSSSWSWWELSGRWQAWCWNDSWELLKPQSPLTPSDTPASCIFSFFQKCTSSLLVLRVW